MIIIEGMDNSGKSTLALAISEYTGLIIQESEGPPKSVEEINQRVDTYEKMQGRLFVRHPVISNHIYGQVRPEGNPITKGRELLFYSDQHIIIYCDAGTRGLGSHVIKAHDTEQHLSDLENNYNKLLYLYRQWAAEHAHFIYRIGDDTDRLVRLVHYMDSWNKAPVN